MRIRRLRAFAIIAAGCVFIPSCDMGVHSTQQIELVVTDVNTGEAIGDALVTIIGAPGEYALQDWSCYDLSPQQCLDLYSESRSQQPNADSSSYGTYSVSTAAEGKGGLSVDSWTPCEFLSFPPLRCGSTPVDQVTGVMFYVRIETDEAAEIVTLDMSPGSRAAGQEFEITVLSVGDPVPVPM